MVTVRSESSGASCAWPVSIPRPELAGHHPPRSPCSRAEGRVPSPSPGHHLSLGRTASPLARFPKPKTDSRMEVEGISGPTQCGGAPRPRRDHRRSGGESGGQAGPPRTLLACAPVCFAGAPFQTFSPERPPGRNRVLDPAAPGKRLLSLAPLTSPFASELEFYVSAAGLERTPETDSFSP